MQMVDSELTQSGTQELPCMVPLAAVVPLEVGLLVHPASAKTKCAIHDMADDYQHKLTNAMMHSLNKLWKPLVGLGNVLAPRLKVHSWYALVLLLLYIRLHITKVCNDATPHFVRHCGLKS